MSETYRTLLERCLETISALMETDNVAVKRRSKMRWLRAMNGDGEYIAINDAEALLADLRAAVESAKLGQAPRLDAAEDDSSGICGRNMDSEYGPYLICRLPKNHVGRCEP